MRNLSLALALLFLASLLPLVGFATRWSAQSGLSHAPEARMPLFTGLGDYSRKVTTESELAQRYFDQGLAFLYGFNHEAAVWSFRAAAEADPNCAMASWGVAAALGPDINNFEIPPAAAELARTAIAEARPKCGKASVVERAMIDAMSKRYVNREAQDQWKSDRDYANAMNDLVKAFPGDPDVGALTAEAMMLAGRKGGGKEKGSPDSKERVVATLEAVLKNSPRHPFALHLWIHAMDDLKRPEKALVEAERLRDLAPAIGHLMHMPSHIDICVGRWPEAVMANERAVAADHAFRRLVPQRGSHLVYMAHDEHMLVYAAMMQGQSKKATLASESALGLLPEWEAKFDPGTVDVFSSMPQEIRMRFGQWDAILAEPEPGTSFPFSRAFRHFARGISFAAKKKTSEAKAEQQKFAAARKEVPKDLLFRLHRATPILDVAEKMLAGEILYREGRVNEGVAALRSAVACEDKLERADPPLWMQPVRHALGATLMDAHRYFEAEAVYREDLKRNPENGWALYGLCRSLQMQNKKSEAALVRSRFEKAWQYADFKMTSSCCCLPEPVLDRKLGKH
jgi:tetratricopeptide (TPR) repeat protein